MTSQLLKTFQDYTDSDFAKDVCNENPTGGITVYNNDLVELWSKKQNKTA